jgi:hypothetical protein
MELVITFIVAALVVGATLLWEQWQKRKGKRDE